MQDEKEEEAEMKRLVPILTVLTLLMTSTPAYAARYIFTPGLSTSDGHLERTNQVTYSLACSGTKTVRTGLSYMRCGSLFNGLYGAYQTFIRFDLTSLAGETIESDSLMIYCLTKGAEDFVQIFMYRHDIDWFPLDSTDFLCYTTGPPALCTAVKVYDELSSVVVAGDWTVVTNSFGGVLSIPGQVNAFSFDLNTLCVTGNPPSGLRYADWASNENSHPEWRPYLIVNTVDAAQAHRRPARAARQHIGDASGLYMGKGPTP